MNVGDVVRVHTRLATPPKMKIALYVGTHFGNHLFLWFNTDPRKRPGQMAVAVGEAPSITRSCFLDCGQAKTFTVDELATAQHCGQASAAFLSRVRAEIQSRATTLTKSQRESIVRALESI